VFSLLDKKDGRLIGSNLLLVFQILTVKIAAVWDEIWCSVVDKTDVSVDPAPSIVRVEEPTQEMETSDPSEMSLLVWQKKTTAYKMSECIHQLITVPLQMIVVFLVTTVRNVCAIHICVFSYLRK